MEIIDRFLRREPAPEFREKFQRSIEALTKEIKGAIDNKNFDSCVVVVSGKGEVFSLGISRLIAEIATDQNLELPKRLIDALNSPMMLGVKFKDVYAGGLGGSIGRSFIEEQIGEDNTSKLLDRPNQLVLYIDDHIGTATKANLVINNLQPLLESTNSQIYFAAPVSGLPADKKTNPKIKVGSHDVELFDFLQKATLDWTT